MNDDELEARFRRTALYLPTKLLIKFENEHGRYILDLKLSGLIETAYFKSKRHIR